MQKNTVPTHLLVANVLQRVRHHGNTHIDQIRGGHLEHLLAELLAILVDLLHRHRAHNGALVTLQRDQRNVLDLLFGFAQKLFASRQQHILVLALDLHLRNAGHRNWHALTGVHTGTFHLQRHCVQ